MGNFVLTYMSIYNVISDRVNEGRLYELDHTLGFPVVRRLIASQEIDSLVAGPWETPEWKSRCFKLRADLDRFLDGALIHIALPREEKPYERKPSAYLRLLHPWPREVWELRSISEEPSLRLFGRFADTDVFIALTWSTRAQLGQPSSRSWRDARVSCRAEWEKLFHPYRPITGENIHAYISSDTFLI